MKDINYVEIIDNIEEIEQIIVTTPRYRRCCYNVLELFKVLIRYVTNIKKSK